MFITVVVNEHEGLFTLWDYTEKGLVKIDDYAADMDLALHQEVFKSKVEQWFAEEMIDAVIWQKTHMQMVKFIKDWLKYLDDGELVDVIEIPLMWRTQLPEIARISGLPEIERIGVYDRVAHEAAIETIAPFPEPLEQIIVACMGDGVSVAAYQGFELLDVNNSLDGEGPMGLSRAGSLFSGDLIKWAFSSGQSYEESYRRIIQDGGWKAWKGHIPEKKWEEILGYQVLKEIGSMRAILKNEVKFIILTGILAERTHLIQHLLPFLPNSFPVYVIPDSNRSLGLARIWVKQAIAN